MKKLLVFIFVFTLILTGCSNKISMERYESLKEDYVSLQGNYNALLSDYEQLKSEYDGIVNESLETMISKTNNDLFADLLIKGLGLNYTYDGTILYDGVAQINVLSEKPTQEEFDYISHVLTEGSVVINSLMKTYELGILYFKVVSDEGFTLFEYSYVRDTEKIVSISVGNDYLKDIK